MPTRPWPYEDADPLVIIVSRDEIERRDPYAIIGALQPLLDNPARITKFRERVLIAFHGYDADPRELFDIQEVRTFVEVLDTAFPFWLYFLSRYDGGLYSIALCRMDEYHGALPGQRIDPKQLEHLIVEHWGPRVNQLVHMADLPISVADELLESGLEYFIQGPKKLPKPGLMSKLGRLFRKG